MTRLIFHNTTPNLHPWRLTWNIVMEVWKIIFLHKWVICRFHVNLPGCRFVKYHHFGQIWFAQVAPRMAEVRPYWHQWSWIMPPLDMPNSGKNFCLKEKLHLSTINDKGISQFFEGARNMFFFLVANVYILVSLLSQLTSLLLGLTCTILWVKSSKIWVMWILGVYMYPVSQRPLR